MIHRCQHAQPALPSFDGLSLRRRARRAERLIEEMRSGVDAKTSPKDLGTKQATRLHQLLHEAKFKDPDGNHLSPAGAPAALVLVVLAIAPEPAPAPAPTCTRLHHILACTASQAGRAEGALQV